MRFFIDGRMDIRPLRSEDKAHIPLPYEYVSLGGSNESEVANGDNYVETFTESDWGEGLDFYFLALTMSVWFKDKSFLEWNQCMNILALEQKQVGPGWSTINYLVGETINPSRYQTYRVFSTVWVGQLYLTFKGDMDKVSSNNRIGMFIENRTGDVIEGSDITIYLKGVVI